MQGISAKEHENIVATFRKFEELSLGFKHSAPLEEDILTYKNMTELTAIYNRFRVLLSELEVCTKEYTRQKKSVQSMMYKRIRKMKGEMQKGNIKRL